MTADIRESEHSIMAILAARGSYPASWSESSPEVALHCPFVDHDDKNPSFTVNTEKDLFYCHGCGRGGNATTLARQLDEVNGAAPGDGPAERPSPRRAPEPYYDHHGSPTKKATGCTLEMVAAAKGLPVPFLADCGWSTIPYYLSGPAVRISYKDAAYEEKAVRFRTALRGPDRFRWKKGSKPMPYGLWRLPEARAQGRVIIVEGETDTVTLWHAEVPAVGVPGASTWDERWAVYFDGITRIYLFVEPDTGGDRLLESLCRSTLHDRLEVIR